MRCRFLTFSVFGGVGYMAARFVTTQVGFRRRHLERERLFFFAAAGLAFSLLIMTLVILNYKSEANAKYDAPAHAADALPATLATVTLWAPERQIPAGTRLSDVVFKEIYWPQNQLPENVVRDLSEIRGMYAAEPLRATLPLQRSQLTKDTVSATIPVTPGNRAVAIEVDAISGIEGHILPGTKVDVALTFSEEGTLTTKVIVQNARVLSYGGDTNKRATLLQGARTINRSVTLDVAPQDALKIHTARRLGTLNLIMRSSEDDQTSKDTQFTENDLQDDAKKKAKQHNGNGSCGRVRIGGNEYVMTCDGQISQLVPSQ